MPSRIKQANHDAESSWKARHDDLEEELQQASMVIVELEDELDKKNRLLADHEREITKMVQQLPPTPAGMKRAQRGGDDGDDGALFAPGLPIGGLLAGSADGTDNDDDHHQQHHHHLRRENERLKSEVRSLLQGAAHAESDAGSVSSDGSFGTAAVPTGSVGGAGHMRAQLEHYKSEVIRLEQKTRALRNEVTYRDNVIVALRDSGGETTSEASAAEVDALRDFASQSTALAEQRSAQVVELQQDLAAAREQQRVVESEASAAVSGSSMPFPLEPLFGALLAHSLAPRIVADLFLTWLSSGTHSISAGLDRPTWLQRVRKV
eukprot:COSAG02_NODE_1272_length_13523_cov_3.824866_10_plen_321_part_00